MYLVQKDLNSHVQYMMSKNKENYHNKSFLIQLLWSDIAHES